MPKRSRLEIEVLRSLYQGDVVRGYNYEVLVTGRTVTGRARIIFNKVQELKSCLLDRIYSQFRARGLQPQDTFAVLYHFYLNGVGYSEERMRQGVGSRVLKEIIDDCREEGVRALYVITKSDSLQAFLEKKRFTCADDALMRSLGGPTIYYYIPQPKKDITRT